MAHIVDATPSSSAGAAQLFAAAAALEDGLEDVTDYSSINRWDSILGLLQRLCGKIYLDINVWVS
jgi:hypothetical protein